MKPPTQSLQPRVTAPCGDTDPTPRRRLGVHCLLILLASIIVTTPCEATVSTGKQYDFKVLAQSGTNGIASIKTSPVPALSFNDKGQVAFVAALTAGGESIFVAKEGQTANIAPSFSTYTFSGALQINNNGTVATRTSGGSPSIITVSTWESATPDKRTVWLRTSTGPISYCMGGLRAGEACSSKFDCPGIPPNVGQLWGCRTISSAYQGLLFPTINNYGRMACIGGVEATNYLVTAVTNANTDTRTLARSMRQPMIADDGRLVARSGNTSGNPIRLFQADLSSYDEITAMGTTFSEVGQYPGISDSGKFVAFYGTKIADGPGIFLYYTATTNLLRVASRITPNPADSNIVAGFSPDTRVSVNNDGVVIFHGSTTNGQPAIFRVYPRLCASGVVANPAEQVVAAGDTLPGFTAPIQSVAIYDSLNNTGAGEIAFLATLTNNVQVIVKATRKQCDVCTGCAPGTMQPALGCVDVTFGLGPSLDGSVPGRLRLLSDTPSANLASPAGLTLSQGGFSRIFANGLLRQLRGQQVLADILVDTPYRYRIQFYTDAGAFDTGTGLFPPIGVPFSIITVENPDGAVSANRLHLIRSGGQDVLYAYDPATGCWEMSTGFANALRRESLDRSTNGVMRTETRTIRDAESQVLAKTVATYQTFPWGEELVQTVEDPDGSARTTAYTYYTDRTADGSNYGQLRSVRYPDGRWEFYKEYHPVYGLRKSVAQLQNNPYTETTVWPDPDNRSTEVVQPDALETRTEYLKGQPVSRRWHLDLGPGAFKDVVATNPAVTNWTDPSNLLTQTTLYTTSNADGARAGQTALVVRPDGTATRYAYYDAFGPDPTRSDPDAPQIEILRTLSWSGQPNADLSLIVDGAVSEDATDVAGNLLWRRQWDIATSLPLSSETVTARDAFGRPTRIQYLDGTYITRTYDCCGLAQETDREGITTTYNTDHTVTLDLTSSGTPQTYYGTTVTRAGISTHTLTDPLGRAFKTILQGTNGALIVQDERHYNTLGDLDWSKDALGRITTYSQTNQGGFTLRTTTFPDGSQSLESTYQDGSAYETKGNAVQRLRYASDVRQDNGVWVQTTTQTRLEADGSLSPEYTTTYTDFAGRAYKTEYPWPDGAGPVFATRAYNAQGQLARSTDPDGLTTLYAYNGRGELETTALDLANPGVMDFGGTDRITRTTSSVENSALRGTVVRKTVTELWETNGVSQSTVLQTSETSADGTQTWTTQYGLTTHTTTVLDRVNQRRTVTTENPDHTSTVTVFEQGRQKSVTRLDKNGARITQTTFAYDAFGRLQTQNDARNGPTTYTYYDDGQLHTVTMPDPDPGASGPGLDPQTTSYTYYRDPANGIKTVTTLPDGGVVTQEYFPGGQLKKAWGARTYPAEYTYDRAGRMATLTTWQQFNFNTGTGLAGSATTRWNYNARGLLANKRYADNKGPGYTYTAGGKLQTRLWARGVLTTYGYDAQTGDLLTTTYSDATSAVTNTYARSGQLQSVTDASGLRTFGYRHGQTATEAYGPGLFAGFTLVRDYDDLDRQAALSVTSPTGAVYHVTYGYDAASRLNAVTSGVDVATYAYHPDSGLVHTLTQAHSNAVRLTTTKLYDKLGRLQSITSVPSADSPISFAYQYNDANQRTRATVANGEYWTYGYDLLGQVTNGVKRFPNGAPIPGYSFGYDFDEIGNRRWTSREAKTDAYTNNALNQISGITYSPWFHVLGMVSNNATITVNGQTPILSNGYFYAQFAATSTWNTVSVQARAGGQATNGTDALAEESGHLFQPTAPVSLQYDDDGNLLSDGRWSMTWDAENRVIKKESLPSVPQTAQRRLEYVTDSVGRRVLVTVSERNSGMWRVVSSRQFLSARLKKLMGIDAAGKAAVECWTWGLDLTGTPDGAGGVGGLLSLSAKSAQQTPAQLPVFDAAGNVHALVSSGSGGASAKCEYDPFGGPLRLDWPGATLSEIGFSTKFTERETGDAQYEFRDYRPGLGRWYSRDPLGESGAANLFRFVNNAPMNNADIHGLALYAFDGTRNLPSDETNPRLTFESGYSGTRWYLPGVGNSQEYSLLQQLIGSAKGAKQMIAKRSTMLELLASTIKAGDKKVDITGFSRGAETAMKFAWAIQDLKDSGVEPFCQIEEIRFIALYDPVAGPGNPQETEMPMMARGLAIAYSIDELRQSFVQSMFTPGAAIKMVGFTGGHSDVGGGYYDRGLANISLEWMVQEAKSTGAPFTYPHTSKSPRLVRHQEITAYEIFGYGSRNNVGPGNGVLAHPSVNRLVEDRTLSMPLLFGTAEYQMYLDTVRPGNDYYRIGDNKF